MLYTTVVIKDKQYKLRLSAKSCVELETRLGGNPLNIFMEAAEGKLPSLKSLLIMFHQSLVEYQHGLTMDDVYSLYDDYCSENENNMMSLIALMIEVFKGAGFIPKDDEIKNA